MDSDDNDIFEIDPETAWLETVTIGGFRVWHIISLCMGVVLGILIMVCCCVRFRIPRTKQEIEADYQRKLITKKFREKLQQIKNSEMDDMDLQKALASIKLEEYEEHLKSIARIQAEFLSPHSSLENLTKEQQSMNLKFKSNLQNPA